MQALLRKPQTAPVVSNPIEEANNLFKEYASMYGSNITLDQAVRYCRGIESHPDIEYKTSAREAVESLEKMESIAARIARTSDSKQTKYKSELLSNIVSRLWRCLK